jgi:pimeloyl-ACP methyl ester carboxylesterase
MQFAYQFPERCERLALVSSGGLGRGLHPLLRAAVLPGAELVLPWVSAAARRGIGAVLKAMTPLGLRRRADFEEMGRTLGALEEPDTRNAFLQTARAIIDRGGQRVSATDKLYLAAGMPVLIVWGERDPLIPVGHGRRAQSLVPGSRLEIFPGAGHYPHLDDPNRFARLLLEFATTTEARPQGAFHFGERLRSGPPAAAAI